METAPRRNKGAAVLLALYVLAGLGVGVGPFQAMAAQWTGRAGLGTFLVINALLPIVAVVFGLLHGRPLVAGAGGPLLAVGFVLGAMLRAQPNPGLWTGSLILQASHPILIAAAIGYAVLGVGAAAARMWIGGGWEMDRAPDAVDR